MKPFRLLAAIVPIVALALFATSGEVSAKRARDNPNYGYCPGTQKRVSDLKNCPTTTKPGKSRSGREAPQMRQPA